VDDSNTTVVEAEPQGDLAAFNCWFLIVERFGTRSEKEFVANNESYLARDKAQIGLGQSPGSD
jgi:hypothetical protein